jgi:hypothetical protein
MLISKDKGLKVLDRLFQDTEKVLSELKKMVDNCLTDTKLCDDPCPSISMGEYLQVKTGDNPIKRSNCQVSYNSKIDIYFSKPQQ